MRNNGKFLVIWQVHFSINWMNQTCTLSQSTCWANPVNSLLYPRNEMLKFTPLLRYLLVQTLQKELPELQNWFICGHDPQNVPWHSCYLSPKSHHGASTNWLCTLHRFCNVNKSKPHFNCALHTKQNRILQ